MFESLLFKFGKFWSNMRGFSRAGATYGLVVCGSCIIGFSDDLRMHDGDRDGAQDNGDDH